MNPQGGVLPAFADLPTEGCTYGVGGGKFHRQQLVEALITTSPEIINTTVQHTVTYTSKIYTQILEANGGQLPSFSVRNTLASTSKIYN